MIWADGCQVLGRNSCQIDGVIYRIITSPGSSETFFMPRTLLSEGHVAGIEKGVCQLVARRAKSIVMHAISRRIDCVGFPAMLVRSSSWSWPWMRQGSYWSTGHGWPGCNREPPSSVSQWTRFVHPVCGNVYAQFLCQHVKKTLYLIYLFTALFYYCITAINIYLLQAVCCVHVLH